jgi:hypothetical protein
VITRSLAALALLLLALGAGGCRESFAIDYVCQGDYECPDGMICGPESLCIFGCRLNSDCPDGQVCSAATNQDSDSDSDSDIDVGCPDPGTVSCEDVGDCAVTPEDCTCLDMFDMGGYCYPDCSSCDTPHECIQGACLYVGQLQWDFDLVIIDPDVGGAGYIDLELTLEYLDVNFVYAYAIVEESYGYAWIIAVAPEGSDGGYALHIGIDLDSYGVGDLSPTQMGTSVTVQYYDSWDNQQPTGLAVSKWDNVDVLTLTTAGTEVGEHVVGSIDIEMMEYTYDY